MLLVNELRLRSGSFCGSFASGYWPKGAPSGERVQRIATAVRFLCTAR